MSARRASAKRRANRLANTAAQRRADKTWYRLLLMFILLAAFGLRCAGLGAQELRGDEAFGYFLSLNPLDEIVDQTLALREPHPVASYWLQHLWLDLAGHSEFALRFLGVWWSVLAVALIVPLAMQLALPTTTGMVAASLMALSPYAIWHAQDARMYSMSLALTTASTLCAVSWWRAQGGRKRLWLTVAYLMVTWLALQTHYFAVYVVLAQQVALLGWGVVGHLWRKLAMWWGIGVGLLLLWLPWLWAARSILLAYGGNGDSPPLLDALIRAHSAFGIGESGQGDPRLLWAAITLGVVLFGAIPLWRVPKMGGRSALWLLMVYWLTPLVATWLSAQSRPIFNERYLVAAVPPVYMLMASGIGDVRSQYASRWLMWMQRGMVMVVMVMMVVGLVRQARDPLLTKTRGWRELASTLTQLADGVDAADMRLVQNYPDPTMWYYYQGDVAHLVLPPAANDETRADAEVEQMLTAGVNRVALVEQPAAGWDSSGIARAALQRGYTFAGQIVVASWPISIWLRPPDALDEMQVAYEGGLQLSGALVTPARVAAGGMVEVHLQWQGESPGDTVSLGEQEAVSIQLLNDGGALVAQSDRPLAMASVTTAQVQSYVILLPIDLAAGDYALDVVVYDPGRDGSPRRLTTRGADYVSVGTVTVVDVTVADVSANDTQ